MVDPYTSDFQTWAARLLEEYSDQGIPGVYQAQPLAWQYWAGIVSASSYFADRGAPSPVGFDNWRDWAAATMLVINPGV